MVVPTKIFVCSEKSRLLRKLNRAPLLLRHQSRLDGNLQQTKRQFMKHLSNYTRSFIFLVIISLGTAYGALVMARQKAWMPDPPKVYEKKNMPQPKPVTESFMPTTGWTKFENKNFPLTFSYPKTWTVKANKPVNGFDSITITTNKKAKITVYISDSGYYAFAGLKTRQLSLPNFVGDSWNDTIVATKAGENYYTFDASQNSTTIPEFKTFLSTAQFTN